VPFHQAKKNGGLGHRFRTALSGCFTKLYYVFVLLQMSLAPSFFIVDVQ
jgi:hypothetical protein